MALFQNNNTHSGALRTPHEKPGFIKYTGVYFRHFWELLRLNLLYILACVPIITIGPATAAMTKLCRNYYQERHVYIWTDFWKAFKDNFKQGMFFGIINILCAVVFSVSIPIYMKWARDVSAMYVPFFITLGFMCVMVMVSAYSFIMVSSTNLKVKQIFKNSLILVYLCVKRSVAFFIIYVAVMSAAILFFPASLIFVVFWPFSFVSFVDCCLCYPMVRKYVIQPYYDQRGEENPEEAYLDTRDERVFVDSPQYETKDQADKKRRKKTIK